MDRTGRVVAHSFNIFFITQVILSRLVREDSHEK